MSVKYPQLKKLGKAGQNLKTIWFFAASPNGKKNVHGQNHHGLNDGPSHKILPSNPLLPPLSQLQAPASFDLEVKADIKLKTQSDLIYISSRTVYFIIFMVISELGQLIKILISNLNM